MGLREDIEITRKVASDLPFGQDEETVMRVCDAAEKWEAIRESLPIVLDAAEKWAAIEWLQAKGAEVLSWDIDDILSAYRAAQEESK